MLKNVLHRLASHPWVYERIQAFVGKGKSQALLRDRMSFVSHDARVLDIGGGTGLHRSCLPASVRYICSDVDPAKLQGFRANYPQQEALLADALQLPVQSQGVDMVMCIAVSHHIPDQQLGELFREGFRVLKPTG